MQPGADLRRYTGMSGRHWAPPSWGHMPGHCRKCGQPSAACCCGCRECRKEAKELVAASDSLRTLGGLTNANPTPVGEQGTSQGPATAFIGGGCCVTLAVEYAPISPTAVSSVTVIVRDSEGTTLGWIRQEPAGTPYRVHECIITTKPGAHLELNASNCTARVRWCEVFSC